MAAGIKTRLWEMKVIVALVPEAASGKRGPFKKRKKGEAVP